MLVNVYSTFRTGGDIIRKIKLLPAHFCMISMFNFIKWESNMNFKECVRRLTIQIRRDKRIWLIIYILFFISSLTILRVFFIYYRKRKFKINKIVGVASLVINVISFQSINKKKCANKMFSKWKLNFRHWSPIVCLSVLEGLVNC